MNLPLLCVRFAMHSKVGCSYLYPCWRSPLLLQYQHEGCADDAQASSRSLGSNLPDAMMLTNQARLALKRYAILQIWAQILLVDAGNVEAIACLGSYQFYSDQPEVAMIYFRRILQLGRPTMTVYSVYKHDQCSKPCSEGTARQYSCSCTGCTTETILSSCTEHLITALG